VQGCQHEVTGQCGFDCDLRRLVVTHLTDQDDVRVGPQDRSQRRRECQTSLDVRLHLVDTGESVLDRVLDRDDVHLGPADDVQGRVERR
jgi:hypothetical protein